MYKTESYCLKCKKNTENIGPEVASTSNGTAMILSSVQCLILKTPDILKIKKQKDY